jgi:fibronectin type 3 domain-containing protein
MTQAGTRTTLTTLRGRLGRLLSLALIATLLVNSTVGIAMAASAGGAGGQAGDIAGQGDAGSITGRAGDVAGQAGTGVQAGFTLSHSGSYPWTNETVESSGDVGMYADMALDGEDDPRLVYYDWSTSDLHYAARDNGSWTVQTVASAGNVGQYASLALDADGHAHISYYDADVQSLRYAEWTGSRWSHNIVDGSGSVGEYNDIALGPNGNPHISYYSAGNQNLEVAEQSGGTWSSQTAAYGIDVGQYSSIAVGSSGNARVAYYDTHNGNLEYAEESSSGWTMALVDAQGDVGRYTDIALDSQGNVHMSYYDRTNGDLKHAAKIHGSGITTETVAFWGDVGMRTSIAVDSDDDVHIAYRDWTNTGLSYAHEDGNGWDTRLVTATGNVGDYASLALDDHDNPTVAHYNWSSYDLELESRIVEPTAPQSLSATAGAGQVTLSWSAPSYDGRDSVDSYRIYRASGSNSPSQVATVGGTTTSFTDSGLSNGQQYTYEVRAVNQAGESNASGQVTATPEDVPTAPQSVSGSAGDDYVDLSWSGPNSNNGAQITDYVVYRGTGPSSLQQVATTSSPGYNDTSVSNGQQYIYEVTAKNSVGEGPASSQIAATPQGPPSTPRNLGTTMSMSGDRVTLTWQSPASNGGSQVTQYTVYRANGSSGLQQVATVNGQTTYQDSSVATGQQYQYAVTASNANGASGLSQRVSVTPVSPPGDPANLQATPGDEEVSLEWDAPADTGGTQITHYEVHRTGPSGQSTVVGTPTVSNFTDVGLTNGQQYTYEVVAVSSAGSSASGPTTTATPLSVPTAPRNVQAAADGGQVTVSWSEPRDDGGSQVTGYEVFRTGDGSQTQVASVSSTQSRVVDEGVDRGSEYEYVVRAVNAAGDSPDSAAASVSVPEPQTPASDSSDSGGADSKASGDDARIDDSESDSRDTPGAADDDDGGSNGGHFLPGGTLGQTLLAGIALLLGGGLVLVAGVGYRLLGDSA